MELSEAIEKINKFKNATILYGNFSMTKSQHDDIKNAIDTVLQALEEIKKQKDQLMELYHQRVQEIIDLTQEVEELKEQDYYVTYLQGANDEQIKWRNKIKEKIEEIKKKPNNPNQKVIATQIDASLIACLKELLKEE